MEAIHVREMSVECPGERAYLRTSAVGYPSPQCAAVAAPAATTPFEACARHRCFARPKYAAVKIHESDEAVALVRIKRPTSTSSLETIDR